MNNQSPNSNHQTNSNLQIPIPKLKKSGKLVIGFWLLFGYWCLVFGISPLLAQDDLAQLKETYFSQHKYSEFVDYLKGFREDNSLPEVSYYIALSRYEQLKYLEETQSWEEYFNRGEGYRQEFIREALNAGELSSSRQDSLFIYAKCLLWRFHKDMQDDQEEAALLDLLDAVKQYPGLADVDLSALKYVADTLSSYADRLNSRKVYNIYLERLITSLRENKEAELISLAKQLAYRDEGIGNPFFAEEVFKKIIELNPDLILDEQTQYLRAYNLEKIRQYKDAYLQYQILVQNYPQSSHYAEVIFKMGVISAYILQDTSKAGSYFTELRQSSSPALEVFASLYQLGLIAQYQGDISQAEEYYHALLEKSQGVTFCADLISKTKARLKEIEENQPLEFNLKTFMDASLKEDKDIIYRTDVDIKVQHFKLTTNQDVRVSSFASSLESGCMPVSLEYLWSGDLGSAESANDQYSLTTHYAWPGTKLILLTVITPSGILGCDLVFLDVIEQEIP